MMEIFALSCLISGFGLLIILSAIDLKIGLLPNVYNAALGICGVLFHGLLDFDLLSMAELGLGALVGGGMLWGIRLVSNHLYNQDTLGLGDVKLLAAGGLWLGPHGILLAITVGAFAGIIHSAGALAYKKVRAQDAGKLSHFSIPAGPGFAVGIAAAVIYQYRDFLSGVFS